MPASMGDNIPKLTGRYINIIVLVHSDRIPWYNNTGKEYYVYQSKRHIYCSMRNIVHRDSR